MFCEVNCEEIYFANGRLVADKSFFRCESLLSHLFADFKYLKLQASGRRINFHRIADFMAHQGLAER